MSISAFAIFSLFYIAGAAGVGAALDDLRARNTPILAVGAVILWPLTLFSLLILAIVERLGR